jgi:transcriptional regulator with XRE-family HTH domain
MDTDLGGHLQRARKLAGFTQAQVGERLGVTQQAVAAWERAQNIPDARQLLALQRLYRVRFGDALPPAAEQALHEAVGEFRAFAVMAGQLAAQASASAERLSNATPAAGVEADERRESSDHHAALPPVVPHPTESRRRKGHR